MIIRGLILRSNGLILRSNGFILRSNGLILRSNGLIRKICIIFLSKVNIIIVVLTAWIIASILIINIRRLFLRNFITTRYYSITVFYIFKWSTTKGVSACTRIFYLAFLIDGRRVWSIAILIRRYLLIAHIINIHLLSRYNY